MKRENKIREHLEGKAEKQEDVDASVKLQAKEFLCITSDASGIYVGGYQRPSAAYTQCRIEKRDLITGALITSFGTGGAITWAPFSVNYAYAIAADASGIYIAGGESTGSEIQWRIEKRDKTTGALLATFGTGGIVTSNPSINSERVYAIAIDAGAIYVAGSDASAGASDPQWRIEKRDKTTGALIAAFGTSGVATSNPTANDDKVYAIAQDASGIYLAGNDYIPGRNEWRIEKRDKTTGALIPAFGTGGVVDITPSTLVGEIAYGITCNASGIYVTGSDGSLATKGQWRTMKLDLTTGKTACTLLRMPTTSNGATPNAIASDTSGVYVAGINFISGNNNYQWLMEKYDLCGGITTSLSDNGSPSSEADPVIAPTLNTGSFTIHWEEKEFIHEVTVYNSVGEIVFENQYAANTAPITLEAPNGIYFVRIRTNTGANPGKASFKKIIIQH